MEKKISPLYRVFCGILAIVFLVVIFTDAKLWSFVSSMLCVIAWFACLSVALEGKALSFNKTQQLQAQIDTIKRHLNLDLKSMAISFSTPQIDELLKKDERLKAIKVLRKNTGLELKEAVDIIDELEKQSKNT